MESILGTVKKMLGIEEDYEAFDVDVIVGINSALMALTQLGVGPPEGFFIKDKAATWSNLLSADNNLEAAKMYVYLKVRLGFDPPTNSYIIDSMNRQISEYEFRLNVQAEGPSPLVEEVDTE